MKTLKDISYLPYNLKVGGFKIDKRTIEGKEMIENIKSLDRQLKTDYDNWDYRFNQKLLLRIKDYNLFFNPCKN